MNKMSSSYLSRIDFKKQLAVLSRAIAYHGHLTVSFSCGETRYKADFEIISIINTAENSKCQVALEKSTLSSPEHLYFSNT